MLFSSSGCSDHIPVEFWTSSLASAIKDYLTSLEQYRNDLDTGEFVADVSRCLVAIGLKGLASPQLVAQVEHSILPEVSTLSPKTLENLLFFLE